MVNPSGLNRVLAVSPHLDDAVISAGACLAQWAASGVVVNVLTLFAGHPAGKISDVARSIHESAGLPQNGNAVVIRRREDEQALTAIGANSLHGDFPDAIYRTTEDGNWLCRPRRSIFCSRLPREQELEAKLYDYLKRVMKDIRPDIVVTCAAIGGHVDHRLAREATAANVAGNDTDLLYWEDLPYALCNQSGELPGIGGRIRQMADCLSWEKKWNALAAYGSQIKLLWEERDWRAELRDHAGRHFGAGMAETFWRHSG